MRQGAASAVEALVYTGEVERHRAPLAYRCKGARRPSHTWSTSTVPSVRR